MMSPFDLARALDYPYDVPARSYRLDVADGVCTQFDTVALQVREQGTREGIAVYDVEGAVDGTPFALKEVCFVVSAGSNASPQQLVRKFATTATREVYCIRQPFRDLAPVYSAHFTSYGAIAACLHPLPGARGDLFVALLDPAALARMHETESLGLNYDFARLELESPSPFAGASARAGYYRSRHGPLRDAAGNVILLDAFAYEPHAASRLSQRQLVARVHARLAPGEPLEAFLARIVGDAAARSRATDALKALRI